MTKRTKSTAVQYVYGPAGCINEPSNSKTLTGRHVGSNPASTFSRPWGRVLTFGNVLLLAFDSRAGNAAWLRWTSWPKLRGDTRHPTCCRPIVPGLAHVRGTA